MEVVGVSGGGCCCERGSSLHRKKDVRILPGQCEILGI